MKNNKTKYDEIIIELTKLKENYLESLRNSEDIDDKIALLNSELDELKENNFEQKIENILKELSETLNLEDGNIDVEIIKKKANQLKEENEKLENEIMLFDEEIKELEEKINILDKELSEQNKILGEKKIRGVSYEKLLKDDEIKNIIEMWDVENEGLYTLIKEYLEFDIIKNKHKEILEELNINDKNVLKKLHNKIMEIL